MTEDESLGQFLTRLRGEELQRVAADRIGIDRSTLSGLENDRLGLGRARAKKLAAGYRVDLDEFEPYLTRRGNGHLQEESVRRIVDERFGELRAELEAGQQQLRAAIEEVRQAVVARRRRSA